MTDKVVSISGMRAGAEEVAPPGEDQFDGAGDAGGGGDDAREHTGAKALDPRCPIVPLGVRGKSCFYLDALKQLTELAWKDHSHNNIKGMFGSFNFLLEEIWPRKKPIFDEDKSRIIDWEVTGWKPEEAAADLMAAASDMGVWKPFEKVRGAGAWRGRDGQLILHCGDAIWIGPPQGGTTNQRGKWHQPGLIDGYVYPSGAPTHRPELGKPVPEGGKLAGKEKRPLNPGDAILADFNTWTMARGELDAHLALGLAASQMIGGALKVRPGGWITGGFGTGKSELVDRFKHLNGSNGIVKLDDATPAAVWQMLKYDTLPVLLDENGDEGDGSDGRRAQAMLKLIRIAVTGGKMGRGGSNHEAAEFTARSSFLCGSILMPPMQAQDKSRIIVLELGKLRQGQRMPDLSDRRWNAMGKAMLSRLAQQWYRFDETLEIYRQALLEAGHVPRTADVFGTVLTCADLVLHNHVPYVGEESFKAWGEQLKASTLSETSGTTPDEVECLQHLLFSPIDPYRSGGRKDIREWIERACNRRPEGRGDNYGPGEIAEANSVLQTFGMRICGTKELDRLYKSKPPPEAKPPYLAVANKHPALDAIYREKRWASGVWAQALKRLPGALAPPQPIWLSGGANDAIQAGSVRVTLVPLYSVEAGQDGGTPSGAASLDAATGPQAGAPGAAGSGADRSFPDPEGDDDLPF